MEFCSCYKVLTPEEAQAHLHEEMVELRNATNIMQKVDELSDVIFAINRYYGALKGVAYFPILPGDKRHIRKIEARMAEYGCIRSKNHMVSHTK